MRWMWPPASLRERPSAHYRGTMSLPTSDGRPGQPREVVRIVYTSAEGFRLFTYYASSGKTFDVKPAGVAGKARPVGVEEFECVKPV